MLVHVWRAWKAEIDLETNRDCQNARDVAMVLHAPSVHSRLAHHQHYHCAFTCHRPLSAPVALALNPPAPVADRRDVLQEAPALLLHHGPTAAPPRRRGLHHHHHGTGAALRQGLHHRLQYCRRWPDGAQPGRVCAAAQAGAGTQAGGRSGSIASCKAGCGGATVGLLRVHDRELCLAAISPILRDARWAAAQHAARARNCAKPCPLAWHAGRARRVLPLPGTRALHPRVQALSPCAVKPRAAIPTPQRGRQAAVATTQQAAPAAAAAAMEGQQRNLVKLLTMRRGRASAATPRRLPAWQLQA